MDTKQIGQFIAGSRKRLGMTQQQLADQLRLSNKTISKWETGEGLPDISSLPALAQLLGTTVDCLLAGGIPSADGAAAPPPQSARPLAEYLLQRRLRSYHILSAVGLLLCGLGTLVFLTTWREWQTLFAVLCGACIWAAGLMLYCVGFAVVRPEVETFARQFGGLPSSAMLRRFLSKSVWLWLLFPFMALDAVVPYYGFPFFPIRPWGYGWHLLCLLAYLFFCLLLIFLCKKSANA